MDATTDDVDGFQSVSENRFEPFEASPISHRKAFQQSPSEPSRVRDRLMGASQVFFNFREHIFRGHEHRVFDVDNGLQRGGLGGHGGQIGPTDFRSFAKPGRA